MLHGQNLSESIDSKMVQVFTLGLLFIICLIKHKVWIHKLFYTQNQHPGPNSYFLGGYVTLFQLRDMRALLPTLADWSRKYGPIFKFQLGPYGITCLNSPDMIEKLLRSHEDGHLNKPFFYDAFKPFLMDGLIVSSGDKWRLRRKILTKHMFSYGTLLNYMKIFNDEGENLIKLLDRSVSEYKPIPIEEILLRSSLNVVTQITLGKKLHEFEQANTNDNVFIDLVRKSKEIVVTKILKPWLFFKPLWRLHSLFKVEQESTKVAHQIAAKCILPVGENNSSFPFLKDLQEAGISREGIVEEAFTILTAGYETTASDLHFLIFLLALHPDHQAICQKEVDEIFNKTESVNIPFSAVKNLKYLEMCLYETLRLLPPIAAFMRKIETPLELGGTEKLPAKTIVAVNVQAIHMNPKYFPSPEQFIPNRFSDEQRKQRHAYATIPFSGGVRSCIGSKFARMEVLVFAAKILKHYEISTPVRFEDVTFLPHVTLTPESPIKFIFKRRAQ